MLYKIKYLSLLLLLSFSFFSLAQKKHENKNPQQEAIKPVKQRHPVKQKNIETDLKKRIYLDEGSL